METIKNPEVLIEQLEYELNNLYGSEFIIDLQKMCGMTSLQSVSGKSDKNVSQRVNYLFMLRGVWYATHQKPSNKK